MLLQDSATPVVPSGIWSVFTEKLPAILIGIGVFLLFIILSKYIRKIFYKLILRRLTNPAVATISASFVSIIFILIGLFLALDILGLDKTVTSLLAGAGILGLVLGLALQDTLTSAVAGIVMTTRKAYKIGDYVESNGFEGVILEINLRNTTILQNNGTQVKIPNRNVLNNPLQNYSLTGERRIELQFLISYHEKLDFVESVIRTALMELDFNQKKHLEVYFTNLGDSGVDVLVRFWIKKVRQVDVLQTKSNAYAAILNACRSNQITIPYPTHTIELKTPQGYPVQIK